MILLLLLCLLATPVNALQNRIPKSVQDWFPRSSFSFTSSDKNAKLQKIEKELLQAIQDLNANERLGNNERIRSLVKELEETSSSSVSQPAISPQIYGRWRLLHTDNAATASPIQRKAVSSSQFPIYQDIIVVDNVPKQQQNQEQRQQQEEKEVEQQSLLLVRQVVELTNTIRLCVDAKASTSAYPLPELTERQGDGKILGWNILGVSLVGEEAQEDPNRPNSRIRFVFDEGNFEFRLSSSSIFKIPYPVPFRLPILRDAVKGWIDITYLSDTMRISRGNKGTTFILQKEPQPNEK